MADQREVYEEKGASLKEAISKDKLTPNEKKLMLDAMNFGYAAGICEKIEDMNGSFFQAQRYQDGVRDMRKMLEK